MKIAVTYDNGQVFAHFGHCQEFKIFEIENGAIISSQVINPTKGGHGALAGFLQENGVNTLICGGIGAGARVALAEISINLYPGVSGDVDESVKALLSNTLNYDPDTTCNHHHEEGHDCGEEKHGCSNH